MVHPHPSRIRLKQAIEWLRANKNMQQKDIARHMGIVEASFSRGLKRCEYNVDSDFIIKFHQATDGVFNLEWLLEGTEPMLAVDVSKVNSRQPESTEIDMLELYAQRIRLVDDLRVTLKAELEEVKAIREELKNARDDFRDATYRLTQYLNRLSNNQTVGIAAEQ